VLLLLLLLLLLTLMQINLSSRSPDRKDGDWLFYTIPMGDFNT
jgi:hypothetical protein